MTDKEKRIIVIQIYIGGVNRGDVPEFVEHVIKHISSEFDDTVKVLYMPVDEVIGDRQVYDISGYSDERIARLEKEIAEYNENFKQLYLHDSKPS